MWNANIYTTSILCLVYEGEGLHCRQEGPVVFVAIQLISVTMEWECRQTERPVKTEIWMLITASIHSIQLIMLCPIIRKKNNSSIHQKINHLVQKSSLLKFTSEPHNINLKSFFKLFRYKQCRWRTIIIQFVTSRIKKDWDVKRMWISIRMKKNTHSS